MMDLKNPKWMYLKAGMFVLMGVVCFGLMLLDHPTLRDTALMLVMIWAFARAYYFAFYVVEKYAVAELPAGLAWRGWTWLSFWPLLWSLCKKRSL